MSDSVQITLIICTTIIILQIIGFLIIRSFWIKDNNKNYTKTLDNERFGYCKSPTYSRPLRPGSRMPGTSTYEMLKNIKPPVTGSGIK